MPPPSFWARARQARLPRVLLIYLGAAWIMIQVTDSLRDAFSLPPWVSQVVILLLAAGLLIISATAWVQSRPGSTERARSEEIPGSWEVDLGDVRESVAEGRLPHLTWARSILGGVFAFLLLFGLAGAWVVLRGPPGTASAGERTMIAVLPFENLGAEEDEYFADGITEEITARLAAIPSLGLISRTSTLQYKKTAKPIPQIGEELGVDYVLEGTVRWQPPSEGTRRVRVTPQLIRVSDDSHVWANVYDEQSAEIFDIQSDIAGQVVSALDITLNDPERRNVEGRPTENLEAYDFFLRANHYYYNQQDIEDLETAVRMYQKAVELDPGFAIAHARLARAHTFVFQTFRDRTEDRLTQARRAVDAAFRIDPDLPEAHLALGYWFYWGRRDYDRALREFATAREARPADADVLEAIGYVQRRQGRFEEALENIREAVRLDPRAGVRVTELGSTLVSMRRYEEAEGALERASSLAPEAAWPQVLRTVLYLVWDRLPEARRAIEEGIAAVGRGRFVATLVAWVSPSTLDRLFGGDLAAMSRDLSVADFQDDSVSYYFVHSDLAEMDGDTAEMRAYADSARVVLERQLASRPDEADWHGPLGIVYAVLGRKEDAIREGKRAVELLPRSKDALSGSHWALAIIFVRVGEYEAAIDELEGILAHESVVSPATLRNLPEFEPLRSNARFRKLAELDG